MAKSFTTRDENYSQWYNDIVKKVSDYISLMN